MLDEFCGDGEVIGAHSYEEAGIVVADGFEGGGPGV